MARPKLPIPTPAEQRALNFLHEHGTANVREYLENGKHPEGHAYTSVMSLLDTMFKKGLVTRTQERRAFRYKPVMSQEETRSAVVANVLDNVFSGDVEALKTTIAELKSGKKK